MKISPFRSYLIKIQQEEVCEMRLQERNDHCKSRSPTFQPILPLVWVKPASRNMIEFFEVKVWVDTWADTPSYKMLMRACDEGSLQEQMDVILGP
jgi:hypothetical protein